MATALPAAVGQPALMALYRQLAAAVGVEVCQILVSRSDLASARAMGDLGQLLREAVGRGLLPIVNGNDATDPLSALDNDQVAVAIAVAAEASRLLFLTDVRAAYRDSSLSERIVRLTPDAGPRGAGDGGRHRPGRHGLEARRGRAGSVLRRRVRHRLGHASPTSWPGASTRAPGSAPSSAAGRAAARAVQAVDRRHGVLRRARCTSTARPR